MNIRPVGAKLFHAHRQREGGRERERERNDETNSHFSQFYEYA